MEQEISQISTWMGTMSTEITTVVISVIFGVVAIRLTLRLIKRLLLISSMDNALISFFLTSIHVVLAVGLLLLCLKTMNISLTSLIAVLSAVGVAIGLAIQDSIANVANGLVMIGTRPFKVGDYVKIGDDEGIIEELRLMNTVLTTRDNRRLILPNKLVFNSRIVNYNMNTMRKMYSQFSVDYDTDLDEALKITVKAAKSCPLIKKDPAPEAFLKAAAAHSLDIDLWCWCDSASYIPANYQLQKAVYDAYKAAGIDIPFEQLTISERPKKTAPKKTATTRKVTAKTEEPAEEKPAVTKKTTARKTAEKESAPVTAKIARTRKTATAAADDGGNK